MRFINIQSGLSVLFLCLTGLLATPSVWGNAAECHGPIFTDTYVHIEGFDIETMTKGFDEMNNDIFWNSSGYAFGGHGLIHGTQTIIAAPFHRSRVVLISESDLANVSLATCSGLTYTAFDSGSTIFDDEIVCVAHDADGNGVFDDGYAAVRLNSHVDDVSGLFAASANLSIVLLEAPTVCDDGNPCTADSCDMNGNCAFATDLDLCSETLAPCVGPEPGMDWENHGEYMSTLAQSTQAAVKNGDLTAEERETIMMNGASTSCGKD